MTPKEIHEAGLAAAQAAIDAAFAGKPEPMFAGFAWVVIKPARGPFVKFLKENDIGSTRDYGGGGYEIWSSKFITRWPEVDGPKYTQSMDIKEVAAYAYAKVLRDNGINAWAGSRAD